MVEVILNKACMPGKVLKDNSVFSLFEPDKIGKAEKFFHSMGHSPTPLEELSDLSARLGLGRILLKDESSFMGLGSFKGRGGIWAMANILAQKVGLREFDLSSLQSALRGISPALFVTATDGNHGKAIAWAARFFGQEARIFMPRGASANIVEEVEKLGAQCQVLNLNYDETVRKAQNYAVREAAILLQDTAWPGYETFPGLIMQGYGTMVAEIWGQMEDFWPDYILLQAGVGSFAASFMAGFILESNRRGIKIPRFISLEPKNAACVLESVKANDGNSHAVAGDLETDMTGLSCGEVSQLAWPILRDNLFAACACSDELAHLGINILSDEKINSGPSGAIGAGFLDYARKNEVLRQLVGSSSNILLVSTEK